MLTPLPPFASKPATHAAAPRGLLARLARAALCAPYTLYAGLVFLGLALLALLLLLVVPTLAARRSVVRAAARAFFFCAGLPLRVRDTSHLPEEPCVVVANHASYLDGVLLTAVLPARFSFVIKREMAGVPLAGLLLRRIGAQFVERANRNRGAGDARRVMRAAGSGQSLVFFPEGTFEPRPGLLHFHAGAFVTAARAGFPVVPVAIRGTRVALPPDGALPRPAVLHVQILAPLHADPAAPEEAVNALRDGARAAISAQLNEPDVAGAAQPNSAG